MNRNYGATGQSEYIELQNINDAEAVSNPAGLNLQSESTPDDVETTELQESTGGVNCFGESFVNVVPGNYEPFDMNERNRTGSWSALRLNFQPYIQAASQCFRDLRCPQLHPCVEGTIKVVIGLIALGLLISLIEYLSALGVSNADSIVTPLPPTAHPVSTPSWTSIFSSTTKSTGSTTPTDDPRCKFFPDCCDTQGEWICER